MHQYSWSTEFSKLGKMLVVCLPVGNLPPQFMVYDENFTLLTKDALGAAKAPPTTRELQWSQSEEVLYGKEGNTIYRLDLAARKTQVFAEFRIPGATGIREFWVGPKDRILANLMGPPKSKVVAIAVFDPGNGKYTLMDPARDLPNGEFHQATLTQNPAGRVLVSYSQPTLQRVYGIDFGKGIDVPNGHFGFLALSNGRYGIVKPVGNCSGGPYWKFEYGIVDDESGEILLRFDCNIPGQPSWSHWGRSIDIVDTFSVTTHRLSFPASRTWQPHYETVLIGKVLYDGAKLKSVEVTPIAYHRSAAGENAQAKGRACGYWAEPRGVLDHTGTRVLLDSTMSHPEWPALDVDGKLKTDCNRDVYVVVAGKTP
jgi:hypothetical protein